MITKISIYTRAEHTRYEVGQADPGGERRVVKAISIDSKGSALARVLFKDGSSKVFCGIQFIADVETQ